MAEYDCKKCQLNSKYQGYLTPELESSLPPLTQFYYWHKRDYCPKHYNIPLVSRLILVK
jgi:hypothetical protein